MALSNDVKVSDNSETNINYKDIIMRFVRHWPWFILSVAISIGIAVLFLRNATPVYRVSSSIILKDARSSMRASADKIDFALSGASSNVANELYVLQSRSIIRKVVDRLNLHTSYIVQKGGRRYDLYNESPVIVAMDRFTLDTISRTVALQLQYNPDKSLSVIGISDWLSIDTTFKSLPGLLPTPSGNISFTDRYGMLIPDEPINVYITNPERTTRQYRSALSVVPPSKYALVLDLSIGTSYPAKGIDFLNTLVEIYNSETIEDNRIEMINTQNFINERIQIINEELIEVEQGVEEFKINQGLTDFSVDMHRFMRLGDQYEQRLVEVETQINIVNSLQNYLENPDNTNKTIPGNIGVTDPMLVATASEYNRLLLDRERLLQSMTPDNPAMVRLNDQIEGLSTNIHATITSVLQSLDIQRRDARNQVNMYGGRIDDVPTQEREYLELSREQHIKSRLFLTLLQKREENSLAMEATANSARVLDSAMVEGKVSPRTMIILLVALLFGFIAPVVIIYLLDLLQYKVQNRTVIDQICKIPVLAEIPNNISKKTVVVKKDGISEMDEAFRILRTNLLLDLGADKKIVLFTSTVPGEGKTFVAINSAISMAIINKKVLLVGMDFRKPKINQYINSKVKKGFTLFLSGLEDDLNQLIYKSELHPNLDILPSGPIPPNPAELLTSVRLDTAFEKLRQEYDYIFIDTPPVAPVTDTLIINRVSDASVYLCRMNFSNKSNLRFANDMMQKGRLSNMLLVVNDTLDYQRKYGYGYGYGNDKKEKKKGWRKLFS